MATKTRLSRWLSGALMLALLELAVVLAGSLAVTGPALAQREDRYPFLQPRQQPRPSGGFFQGFFGSPGGQFGGRGQFGMPEFGQPQPQPQADYSRAPPPRKSDTTPTISIMVLGDSMADWLGYGLEEAFSDSPEIAIIRKAKQHSGLIRYEARSELDWWHVARDEVAKGKLDFVVMMLGINDRQSIRETQAEQTANKKPAKADTKTDPAKTDQDGQDKDKAADKEKQAADEPDITAPARGRRGGSTEFRTEKWEEIYTKRIDETVAALKSKGVPVLWVGLPALRGPRATADVVYLNDLYRARAEKAGIVYVDDWDGFVDEAGKFTTHGPDFEGQIRRLRSGDGVHFTKNGARKLAHYVEREVRRVMANRSAPIALPADGVPAPAQTPAGPAVRPVAGPVMPLTAEPVSGDELLGGSGTRPAHPDPTATRVLVKGEPVASAPGRADDFSWPRPSDPNIAEPLSPTAAAARAEPATPARSSRNARKELLKDSKPDKSAKTTSKTTGTAATAGPAATTAKKKLGGEAIDPPRPKQPVRGAERAQPRDRGPFGMNWLR